MDLVLDVSFRSVAAAAAVGLVLAVLRVRSGAARHAAWSAVLLTMLTMPVMVKVTPRVSVPVPPSVVSSFDRFTPDVSPELSAGPRPTEDVVGQPSTARLQRPALDTTVPVRRSRIDVRPVVIGLYGAGALLVLIHMIRGWLLTRRLIARAVRVACDNRAPVFETPAIAAPMTAGIVSPCVLVPVEWRTWPDDTVRAVFAHENAHIARRDALVALLAQLNRAIFWFHPLAWWLERTLAVTAEHACDEVAAREMGQPRRYAEVLLDMVQAVRHRGHRVSWQTLGVDGSGLLGTRIDRLLKGDAMARMSAVRRAAVAVACAVILVLAIACRQQIAAAPLRPDPDIQKRIAETDARMERHRAAVAMTVEQAQALERSLDANPDNVEAHESLIIFYDQSGKPTWEEKLAGIRKHSLWRIAHLPETDLWIPNISKRYDPVGYEQAKELWFERTRRQDVTAKTLGRAAAFFTAYDKPLAEELLLRAERMEPAGPWTDRLMDLYAQAVVGVVDSRYRAVDTAQASSAFAADARRKIEASTDPKLVANAGYTLMRWAPAGSENAALAKQLLQRAIALDPQNVRARTGLAGFEYSERFKGVSNRLRSAGAPTAFDDFSDTTAQAIAALPVDDRLFYLPAAAESAYMRAESIDYTAREKPEAERSAAHQRAEQGFARARQHANDALALARTNQEGARANDVVYRAETVLGVLALKDGDVNAAVEHMQTAAATPVPDPPFYASQFGLRSRLAEYLLRAGERASVADYLQRSADHTPIQRDQLLKDAARIREGMMPMAYQYAEARR